MNANSVQSMVNTVSMTKVADYKLPNSIDQWQHEILQQFFEKFQTLPPQYSVDVVLSNTDENRGYAKGSVVVGGAGRKINFPVVVNDFMLSPFDVFVSENGRKQPVYLPATADHIDAELLSTDYGEPSTGPYSSYDEAISLKRPGGIPAKIPVIAEDISKFSAAPHKWRDYVLDSDMKTFIEKLAAQPELPAYFEQNSGQTLRDVIDMPTETANVPSNHIQGSLDYGDVIRAKKAVTIVDTMLFNPDKLVPITAGSVAELRTKKFPSLEDYLQSGDSQGLRRLASDMGQPITGLVIEVETPDSWNNGRTWFISAKGGYYSRAGHKYSSTTKMNSTDKVGTEDDYVFYGTDLSRSPVVADAVFQGLRHIRQIWAMTRPRYDRGFVDRHNGGETISNHGYHDSNSDAGFKPDLNAGVLVVYYDPASKTFKGYKPQGELFRMANINGNPVYVDDQHSSALITAPVQVPTPVSTVDAPEYRPVTNNKKYIVLIPEQAVVINLCFMHQIQSEEFLKPGDDIRRELINAGVDSVKVAAFDDGIYLTGKAIDPICQLMGIDKTAGFEPADAVAILKICGVDSDNIREAMTKAASGVEATIFGVRGDYVEPHEFIRLEKVARIKDILAEEIPRLKIDLIKAASLIEDPEAVDTVLSLNFINRENLMAYVEDIAKFDDVVQRLCQLLVASRMGLKPIDEAAVKSAIEGLDGVVKGLIEIRTSLGV